MRKSLLSNMQKENRNAIYKQLLSPLSYIFILCLFVIYSCSEQDKIKNSSEFKNSPKQIKEARIIVENFNSARLNSDFEKMFFLLKMENISKSDYSKKKIKLDSLLGKIASFNFIKANSVIKMEADSIVLYSTHLEYNTVFEKKNVIEEFEVEKIRDSLKITYYNLKINI